MTSIRRLSAADGLDWYRQGWGLFKAQPAMLVLLFLAVFVLYMLLGLIPLGGLILAFVAPALCGGYYLALRQADAGVTPGFEHLFRAFTDADLRNPMLTLGLVALGAQILMALIGLAMIGGSIGAMTSFTDMEHGALIGMGGMGVAVLALLANLVIAVAVWLALFFAIPLVMLDGVAPVEALKLSLQANLSNFLPWLVFSLALIPLTVIAMIPFGLGLLVLFPIVGAAIYRAYGQTFEHRGSNRTAAG